MSDQLDFDTMSLEDLRELRAQADRAISGFTERKRRDAMAAAEEAVRAHGFSSLADLTRTRRGGRARAASSANTATRAPGAPRYANPDDDSQTWSGRGRRPRWVVESLEAGKDLSDLAI